MPARQYQIAVGAKASAVAVSTPADFGPNLVRLQIDYVAGLPRQRVIEAIEELKEALMEGAWPPA
ncbi:MAG: hypothetical protein MUE77_06505 [Sandarakinorhabdus sp.]|jgi:hypothetical protein|nr:hypothetical protein [Sandarakinorhabdus sp.]